MSIVIDYNITKIREYEEEKSHEAVNLSGDTFE